MSQKERQPNYSFLAAITTGVILVVSVAIIVGVFQFARTLLSSLPATAIVPAVPTAASAPTIKPDLSTPEVRTTALPATPTTASARTGKLDLSLTISPTQLMVGTEGHIHVQISNPGRLNLQGYTLEVWYTSKNINIQSIPLSAETGETFEQDISWQVDDVPSSGNSIVTLMLITPDKSPSAETVVPIEFVKPTLVVSITPIQLTGNTLAVIHIQVDNPSGADWHGYKLLVGYAAKGDIDMTEIQAIPLSLTAGEVFKQDIRWDERSVPSSGEYEIRMGLVLPNYTVLAQTATSFTLSDK